MSMNCRENIFVNCNCCCQPAICPPLVDLVIQKTGPATVNVNGIATYTVIVSNGGTVTATNITVRDVYGAPTLAHIPIPIISIGTIVNDGTLQLNSGTFNWLIPMLSPGAIATLTFNIEPTATGQILNYATITNYNEIRQDVNFLNNQSRVFTTVV